MFAPVLTPIPSVRIRIPQALTVIARDRMISPRLSAWRHTIACQQGTDKMSLHLAV